MLRLHTCTMKRKNLFSLSEFILRHGEWKKKKSKKQLKVRFSQFTPVVPIPKMTANTCDEGILCQHAHMVVFNHLMIALGLHGKHGERSRRDVFLVDSEELHWHDDDCSAKTFMTAFDFESRDWLCAFDQRGMMEDLVMPMACSFVHQTPHLSRIKRFQRDIEACSAFLKKEHSSRRLCLIVADHLNSDHQFDMCDDADKDAFEKSGWECNVGHLFLLLLESYTEKVRGIVDELDFLFKSRHAAATVEDMIRKQVWEVLVCDWVKEWGREEDYIRLYETKGGLLWCLDYVVPERQRHAEESESAFENS
jgi:hypothetical protein